MEKPFNSVLHDPPNSAWHLSRGLIFFLTTTIFIAGLLYNYTISKSNSKNLNDLQEKVYPSLEKSTLLKIKLIIIQEEFYNAISQKDETRLLRVEEEGEAFSRLLLELEPLSVDPGVIISIRATFSKYLRQGKELSRHFIQEQGIDLSQLDRFQPQLFELSEQGKLLNNAIDQLNEKSRTLFNEAMGRSEGDSRRMLQVGLLSSIAAFALIGGVSGWIITLNRRLFQANQHLEDEVKVRTRELESFVYTVSHDLKSPVVSMQGMASMFMKSYGAQLEEKGRHYIERVIANANYMEELITALLILSRVGRRPSDGKKGTPAEVLQEILEIHRENLSEKKIEVVIRPDLPHFIFDRVQLTQLFENLISNAAKFMGDQPHPRIEIGGRLLRDEVEFYIKDNGIGIDPAYHEKIFSIFQRLKDVNVDGTGVGLSIAKKIVDLAGGKIWVDSGRGEGATFYFKFPR